MREHVAIGRQVLQGRIGACRGRRHTRQAPGRARVALLATLICLGMLALGASSAQALLVRTGGFGSEGVGAGQFGAASPTAVAVNESTGDVYVADSANARVEQFDSTGKFLAAFGWGVADGASTFETCTSSCQAGVAGSGAGQFANPTSIAVDNSGGASEGDVYVGDRTNNVVSKFSSSGSFLATINGSGTPRGSFAALVGVAVDQSGNLWTANDQSNVVDEFDDTGSYVSGSEFSDTYGDTVHIAVDSTTNAIYLVRGSGDAERWALNGTGETVVDGSATGKPGSVSALAVDPATGNLYAADSGGTHVTVFNPSNTQVDSFALGDSISAAGLAFYSTPGTLYVADPANSDVDTFGPPSPASPVVDSESASNVGNQNATVNALVNPFGLDTTCTFQYVDDTTFQSTGFTTATSVPCSPADLGTSFLDQAASANLTGLTLNTTYDFRVVATNADGTTDGNATTFTTLGPASIDSESASNVGSTTAELDTSINPLGNDTTCQLQYVDDTDFQSSGFTGGNVVTVSCTPQDLGAGNSDVSALADISGLTPNTLYDFRAVATNTLGTENGTATQFTTGPIASIDSESASNIGVQSAELDTSINPEGTDTTCQLQYVNDATFQVSGFTGSTVTTVGCTPADLGAGIGDVSASAQISGLQASTKYDFRAVATNSLGTVDGGATPFTTTPPVSVDSESVTNVTDTGATLKAQLNPNGLDTHYQFQYVTDANFQSSGYADATTVPHNAVDIGSGTSDQSATVDLTGLQPSTKYHFRATASNSAGAVNGNDQTFTTYASGLSTSLPDKRAYEMVTPANKDNGELYDRGGTIVGGNQASSDGNTLAYFSFNAFPGSQFDGSYYVANRGASSWASQNVAPPQSTELGLLCASLGPAVQAYTQDLSKWVLADGGALLGSCGSDLPPLVQGEPKGVQNLFVRNTNGTYQLVDVTPAGVTPANATFDAASVDLSHVVFDESAQLTPNAPSGADNLYEETGGAVRLVTVVGGTGVAGSLAGGSSGRSFHAVSDDGSKIFFTANGNLYVRENGTTTVQVDASQASGTGGGGQFLAATSTGSNVFFTDDASAGLTSDTAANSGANLYDYNTARGALTDLTPATKLGPDGQAQVDGLSGITGDGSFLYFVANGSLATGATSGQPNLYLLQNGTITFITTLSGGDGSDWSAGSLSARISSNGSFLAFTSTSSLTGFNNNGSPEIFLYDSGAKKVSCASCNPSGVPATAGAAIAGPEGGVIGGGSDYLQRFVSDSGQVFFNTTDALLPADTNGKSDVYEYESGQLHLISSGTSVDPSLYVDSSTSGNDVFFATSQQLVPQDTDGGVDVYDARVDGGFPASAPAPSCQGEGCKPPLSATPSAPVVASVTFFGPGNVKSARAARVAVLRETIKGTRITLHVKVPAKGRVSASGAGLRTVSRSVRGAGTYTLTVRLKPRAMTALKHKRKLKLTISVRYVPARGSASTATVKLTVEA
jgi:NHL repeat